MDCAVCREMLLWLMPTHCMVQNWKAQASLQSQLLIALSGSIMCLQCELHSRYHLGLLDCPLDNRPGTLNVDSHYFKMVFQGLEMWFSS